MISMRFYDFDLTRFSELDACINGTFTSFIWVFESFTKFSKNKEREKKVQNANVATTIMKYSVKH